MTQQPTAAPIAITIDDARLANCLRDNLWQLDVPTTVAGWNMHWHKAIREIIDYVVDDEDVITAPGLGRSVTLRYDFLRRPRGIQVSLRAVDGDTFDGIRLATVDYQIGNHFAADHPSEIAAARAFVHALIADLNHQFADVQNTILNDSAGTNARTAARRVHMQVTEKIVLLRERIRIRRVSPHARAYLADTNTAFRDAACGSSNDAEHEAGADLAEAAEEVLHELQGGTR